MAYTSTQKGAQLKKWLNCLFWQMVLHFGSCFCGLNNSHRVKLKKPIHFQFSIDPRYLFIKVGCSSFDFECLEAKPASGQRETFKLYRIPTITFFGRVDPGKTEIKVDDIYVKVNYFANICFQSFFMEQVCGGWFEVKTHVANSFELQ